MDAEDKRQGRRTISSSIDKKDEFLFIAGKTKENPVYHCDELANRNDPLDAGNWYGDKTIREDADYVRDALHGRLFIVSDKRFASLKKELKPSLLSGYASESMFKGIFSELVELQREARNYGMVLDRVKEDVASDADRVKGSLRLFDDRAVAVYVRKLEEAYLNGKGAEEFLQDGRSGELAEQVIEDFSYLNKVVSEKGGLKKLRAQLRGKNLPDDEVLFWEEVASYARQEADSPKSNGKENQLGRNIRAVLKSARYTQEASVE